MTEEEDRGGTDEKFTGIWWSGPFGGLDGTSPDVKEAALDHHWNGFAKHRELNRPVSGQRLVCTRHSLREIPPVPEKAQSSRPKVFNPPPASTELAEGLIDLVRACLNEPAPSAVVSTTEVDTEHIAGRKPRVRIPN